MIKYKYTGLSLIDSFNPLLRLLTFSFLLISLSAEADIDIANKAYMNGKYELAFKEYETLAKQGNVDAQARLGTMYFWGLGTAKSEVSSYSWSLKAAKQNNPAAQHMLAYFYENGIYIGKNIRKAIEWYSKAASQEHAEAIANLAGIYLLSQDIPQDEAKGIKFAKEAAKLGSSRGQFLVGHVHHHIEKDLKQAIIWYEKAAINGNGNAANFLGKLYFNGDEIEQDRWKSFFWFSVAEELNCPSARIGQLKAGGYLEIEDIKKIKEDVTQWMLRRTSKKL